MRAVGEGTRCDADFARALALDELRAVLDQNEAHVERLSRWSVAQHVEHCALAMGEVCAALTRSTPPAPRTWRTLVGSVVLALGRLPRGRARAPESTCPRHSPTRAALAAALDEAELDLARARVLPAGAWVEHFALGPLTRPRALRFLAVHNRHHLSIVREILAASRRS